MLPAVEGEALAARIAPQLSAVAALSAQPGVGAPGLAWATYPTYRIAHARPVVVSSNFRRGGGLTLSEGDVRIGASVLYVVRDRAVPSRDGASMPQRC